LVGVQVFVQLKVIKTKSKNIMESLLYNHAVACQWKLYAASLNLALNLALKLASLNSH